MLAALLKTYKKPMSWLPALALEVFCLAAVSAPYWPEEYRQLKCIHLCALILLALPVLPKRLPKGLKALTLFCIPGIALLALELAFHSPADLAMPVLLLNMLFVYLLGAVLLFAIGHSGIAMAALVLMCLLWGLANSFVVEFRSSAIMPWDLASVKVAASVAGDYAYIITPNRGLSVAISAVLIGFGLKFSFRLDFHRVLHRILLGVLSLGLLLGAVCYVQTEHAVSKFSLYPAHFNLYSACHTNGVTINFLMNLHYLNMQEPEGYDRSELALLSEGYPSDDIGGTRPNVIVIMNESLADMSVIYDYETSEDCLPFTSSLTENCLKGYVHVPVYGGNTPNSELEFLTGMSMAFFPAGCVPYQQYLLGTGNTYPCFTSKMDQQGYRVVAMHPYLSTGWLRDRVYPLMGFEEMYFLDWFEGCDTIRNRVSDMAMYEKCIEFYEQKGDEPLFLFGVTMQNHGGYYGQSEDFEPQIVVKGLEDETPLTVYMSMLRESDRAFEMLIEYFSTQKEPTVVLMFGDHQPGLGDALQNVSGSKIDRGNMAEAELQYMTPYLIWANYPLQETGTEDFSLNYLSAVLSSTAQLPMTGADKFLLELKEQYPILTARCAMDAAGNYIPVSEFDDVPIMRDYAAMQYNFFFDKQRQNSLWELCVSE